jgi:hypothetical protein
MPVPGAAIDRGGVHLQRRLARPVTNRVKSAALALACRAALILVAAGDGRAQHACDAAGEEGWRVVPTVETVAVKDGAPYRAGDDWVVERTVTLLPLCNYFNAVGTYSLRSYSLDPRQQTERVVLCRGGVPVAPYAGACG